MFYLHEKCSKDLFAPCLYTKTATPPPNPLCQLLKIFSINLYVITKFILSGDIILCPKGLLHFISNLFN